MRKVVVIIAFVALAAAWSGVVAQAGSGCCPYSGEKKADAKAQGKKVCSTKEDCLDVFSGLDLSDEQKASLEKLAANCDETKCDETSMSKWNEGVKEILSEEQLAQLKESCKSKGRSCSLTKE